MNVAVRKIGNPKTGSDYQFLFEKLNNLSEEEKLKMLISSYRDELTGSKNRKYLFEYFSDSGKHSEEVFIYCDIDNFKKINDEHGHAVGDEVLKEFVSRLTPYIKKDGFISRIGGDEFCIIAKNVGNLVETLEMSLNKPISTSEGFIKISASFGCSLFTGDVQKTLRQADKKMYITKEKKKRIKKRGLSKIFNSLANVWKV